MKLYAYIILSVLLLSIFIEPFIEISLVYKDKIALGAAITNSCRVAKSMSYSQQSMQNLDAVVNREIFTDNFSTTFQSALNIKKEGAFSDQLHFKSSDGRNISVTLTFTEVQPSNNGPINTNVKVVAVSDYVFKTKYLKQAKDLIKQNAIEPFKLEVERNYNMSIKN